MSQPTRGRLEYKCWNLEPLVSLKEARRGPTAAAATCNFYNVCGFWRWRRRRRRRRPQREKGEAAHRGAATAALSSLFLARTRTHQQPQIRCYFQRESPLFVGSRVGARKRFIRSLLLPRVCPSVMPPIRFISFDSSANGANANCIVARAAVATEAVFAGNRFTVTNPSAYYGFLEKKQK